MYSAIIFILWNKIYQIISISFWKMPDKATRIEKVSSKNDTTCIEKNANEEGNIYY